MLVFIVRNQHSSVALKISNGRASTRWSISSIPPAFKHSKIRLVQEGLWLNRFRHHQWSQEQLSIVDTPFSSAFLCHILRGHQ